MESMQTTTKDGFDYLFLPGITGGGVMVRRNQVVGARPNGPNQGAIVYTEAGPSLYTSLTTEDIARAFNASKL